MIEKLVTASTVRTTTLAALVALAMLIAPICAPLCAAASCGGGHEGETAGHCHQMVMLENGASMGANHAAACGNGELMAMLNDAGRQEFDRHLGKERLAAGDLPGVPRNSAAGTNDDEMERVAASPGPKLMSSSIVVLKI
jgi:hypothetical protein